MKHRKRFVMILSLVLATLLLMACSLPFGLFKPSPTPTSTPIPPVAGEWTSTVVFEIGDEVNTVGFSFTVSQDNSKIEHYVITDLGLGVFTMGPTSIEIMDRTFTMNADTQMDTTEVVRVFEGTFIGPDKVEGTYAFDYGRAGTFEGEWTGAPKSEE